MQHAAYDGELPEGWRGGDPVTSTGVATSSTCTE